MAAEKSPLDAVLPELDGVRALAIAVVLAHHGSYGVVKGGFVGVDLFFVLSGFLITRLLAREWARNDDVNLLMFFARRGLRIVPPLLVALALAAALGSFDWQQGATPILAFYANYVDPLRLGTMVHTWSLAVEEQFYLLWPVLFAIAMRLGGGRTVVVIALLAFLTAVAFRQHCLAAGMDVEMIYRHGLARSDSLAAGCLVALVDPARWRQAAALILYVFLTGLAVLCFVAEHTHWLMLGVGNSLFAIACAVFIAALLAAPATCLPKRLAVLPFVSWIGRRSYGIYLFHVPIFVALEPFRERQNMINFLLVQSARIAATLILAELSWRLIEAPVLSLKRYFYPERAVDKPSRAGEVRQASEKPLA